MFNVITQRAGMGMILRIMARIFFAHYDLGSLKKGIPSWNPQGPLSQGLQSFQKLASL